MHESSKFPVRIIVEAWDDLGTRECRDEVVLVECEAEMVDPRQLPLAGLDDDVHRAALELRQAQLEAQLVELFPAVAGLERARVLVDSAVPGDQVESELSDIARLDLAHLAGHQVVMEELHEGRLEPCSPICPSTPAGLSTRCKSCRPLCWQSSMPAACGHGAPGG